MKADIAIFRKEIRRRTEETLQGHSELHKKIKTSNNVAFYVQLRNNRNRRYISLVCVALRDDCFQTKCLAYTTII